jgi:hypothetical protein
MPLRGCPIVDEDLLAEKYHVCFQLFMSSPNLYLRLYRLFIATSAVIALRSLAGGNSGKKGGFPTKSKKDTRTRSFDPGPHARFGWVGHVADLL